MVKRRRPSKSGVQSCPLRRAGALVSLTEDGRRAFLEGDFSTCFEVADIVTSASLLPRTRATKDHLPFLATRQGRRTFLASREAERALQNRHGTQ